MPPQTAPHPQSGSCYFQKVTSQFKIPQSLFTIPNPPAAIPHFFENLYARLVSRLLPSIAGTGVTPNQVTFANLANLVLIVLCLSFELWLIASLLIQVYVFLDITDGALARHSGLSSHSGQILDKTVDHLFYTLGFMAIGYYCGNTIFSLFVYAIAINAYIWITTYHIAPRLKSLPTIKRPAFEKWFTDRKIAFAMDRSLQCVAASLLLLSIWRPLILPLVTLLYSTDLLYRLIKLRHNVNKLLG